MHASVCVQSERDGLTQFRGNVDITKKRVTESETRVDTKLGGFIGKKYWCAAPFPSS